MKKKLFILIISSVLCLSGCSFNFINESIGTKEEVVENTKQKSDLEDIIENSTSQNKIEEVVSDENSEEEDLLGQKILNSDLFKSVGDYEIYAKKNQITLRLYSDSPFSSSSKWITEDRSLGLDIDISFTDNLSSLSDIDYEQSFGINDFSINFSKDGSYFADFVYKDIYSNKEYFKYRFYFDYNNGMFTNVFLEKIN